MSAVVRSLFRTATVDAQPASVVAEAPSPAASPLGGDCLCGRGAVIGTCIATSNRLMFRAFHESPVTYHLERVTNWACVDCVADAALDVANGVVRERMREASRQRAEQVASLRPGEWIDPDPEGNAWPTGGER